jgi:AraC family transcriptional regulator
MTQDENCTDYAKFYKTSPYAAFPQEHRHAPGRLPFYMIMVDQAAHAFVDPDVSETIICLPLMTPENCIWSWDMGHGWRRERAAVGRMLVLPANIESQWQVTGPRRLLLLVAPSRTIKEALGPVLPNCLSDAFGPLADTTWEDPLIHGLMMRLWEATAGTCVTDRLLVDGLVVGVLAHLLQRAGTFRRRPMSIALPRWRLQRVFEFADAHLHEDIDLVALSQVADLSPRHFTRAFHHETGETPHRWLMTRRLERAKHLLATTDSPIVRVAETCGFAGQSHLNKLLKQATGLTPLRWRNEKRCNASLG